MTILVPENSDFSSNGCRCAAWLFRPEADSHPHPPVIVMAHGFAGQRDFGLSRYAECFASHGMATLVFDYRYFGASEGEPRGLVDHRRQHQDWLAAIAHARSIPGIDSTRTGLWGSSYSGGHVISLAANDPAIAAIVAQIPMVDGMTAVRVSGKYVLAAAWHAVRDYARKFTGRQPHYVPVVAPPDEFAALNQPGCVEGFRDLVPDQAAWLNRCTARSLLSTLSFRPSRLASKVNCPAMIVIAEHDQVIHPRAIQRVANRIQKAEVVRYPVDHFGVYQGKVFDELSRSQSLFFARHFQVVR